MVTDAVMEEYKEKTRTELKITASFAKDALRELRRGNYRVAIAQAQEAEGHLQETKTLLKEMNHLSDMERTNNNVERAIILSQEVNDKEKQLEKLETQLIQVKEAAGKESSPEPLKEEHTETEQKI